MYEPKPGTEYYAPVTGAYFAEDAGTGEEIFRESEDEEWSLW